MRRIIVILPAAKCRAANEWLVENFGPSMANTFTPTLNPTGDPTKPKTHAVCNWALPAADFEKVNSEFSLPGWAAKIAEGETDLRAPRPGKKAGPAFIVSSNLKPVKGHEGR